MKRKKNYNRNLTVRFNPPPPTLPSPKKEKKKRIREIFFVIFLFFLGLLKIYACFVISRVFSRCWRSGHSWNWNDIFPSPTVDDFHDFLQSWFIAFIYRFLTFSPLIIITNNTNVNRYLVILLSLSLFSRFDQHFRTNCRRIGNGKAVGRKRIVISWLHDRCCHGRKFKQLFTFPIHEFRGTFNI